MQRNYTIGILSFYYESRRMEIFPIPQTAVRNFTSGEANKIRNIASPQREILVQMKECRPKTYLVYFEVCILHSWSKRSALRA